ncbi:MAG: hypothetical protein QM737_21790 [Ferruginibacter sp.]
MKTIRCTTKTLAFLILIPIIFFSCKKDTASKAPDPVPVVTIKDVYAVGNEESATGFDIAMIWKNGVATSLSADGDDAYAESVFVSGNDVYVSGEKFINGRATGSYYPIPMLWKNGIEVPISNSTDTVWGSASSVCVSGSDVYVAVQVDSDYNQTTATIRLYKNGVGTDISGDHANLYSMFVSGSDVYISGTEFNLATLRYESKLWKNGIPTFINPNTSGNDEASHVFVTGNDVYLVGRMITALPASYATVWKNGVASYLTDGTRSAWATSVYVSGTDVYVAGNEYPASGESIPKFWKNGIATDLTDGTHAATAASIFVSGTDVYVAGIETIAAGQVATIWKNGVATHLTNSTQAWANSVLVTSQ